MQQLQKGPKVLFRKGFAAALPAYIFPLQEAGKRNNFHFIHLLADIRRLLLTFIELI
jgi:hypothetical protein